MAIFARSTVRNGEIRYLDNDFENLSGLVVTLSQGPDKS